MFSVRTFGYTTYVMKPDLTDPTTSAKVQVYYMYEGHGGHIGQLGCGLIRVWISAFWMEGRAPGQLRLAATIVPKALKLEAGWPEITDSYVGFRVHNVPATRPIVGGSLTLFSYTRRNKNFMLEGKCESGTPKTRIKKLNHKSKNCINSIHKWITFII